MKDTSREIIGVAVREGMVSSRFSDYPIVAAKAVCNDCGVVYVIRVKSAALVEFSLAERYHTFLEGEFIHDHIEYDEHRDVIGLPAALELPPL